jgi:hypothetical protein
MSLKFKEEYGISSNLEGSFDDDIVVALKLSLFASNIKREIYGVRGGFLLFFKKYEKKIK